MLTYSLDASAAESLYGQLYRCIRADIESGVVAPGAKLPSKRALARNLGVSLTTVEAAYTQLAAEGYVRSAPRSGYFANRVVRPAQAGALPGGTSAAPSALCDGGGRAQGGTGRACGHGSVVEGAGGLGPAADADEAREAGASLALGMFPFASWAKAVRDTLSHEPERVIVGESPSMGLPRLREALAAHLRAFRGLDADPARIVVGAGAQTLYHLFVQLLGRDTHFAVEDPGYPRLSKVYRCNDVRLSHIPLDGHGINVEALRESGADVVHLMPSHQFPTGLVTPVSRRYELLGWATEAPGRWIIEDDYDCEFRLSGRPIPAMKSIDAADCVVYANTFSRSLGPAFRMGYAVLPERLARRYERELGFYSCTVPTLDQLAMARFIEEGSFERHINRMRSHCRTLQSRLAGALSGSTLAGSAHIEGADAGLHFLLGIDTEASEAALAAAARGAGLDARPLSSFHAAADARYGGAGAFPGAFEAGGAQRGAGGCPGKKTLVVSYAGLDAADIEGAVAALAAAADDPDATAAALAVAAEGRPDGC